MNFDHITARLEKPEPTKHQHEYQELCEELQPIYGKLVWTLPHQVGITEWKIREAHRIAQQRKITTFAYLRGIIKKLPY